jgi:hypothetical protein
LMLRVCDGREKTGLDANKNVLGIVAVNLMLTLIRLFEVALCLGHEKQGGNESKQCPMRRTTRMHPAV